MINKVIICGVRRANHLIPEIEIRQMIGRCARDYDYVGVAEAIIVVNEDDRKTADGYLYDQPPAVESQMDKLDQCAFHILPYVFGKVITDDITAMQWFNRTLAFAQGKTVKFDELYEYLRNMNMIDGDMNDFYITELGKVSCKFYFKPKRIYTLYDKLNQIRSSNLMKNNYAISWLFASDKVDAYVADHHYYDEYLGCVRSLHLDFDSHESLDGLAYYCTFSDYRPKELKYVVNEKRDDMGRLLNAVRYIYKAFKWDIGGHVDIWEIMFRKRVEYDVAKYMLEGKIDSKAEAYENMGFTND